MPEHSTFHPSQKLVRCQVVNRYQEASVRFVEIGAFRLWEYLMTNKHGLSVSEPTLCLWIDENDYQRSARVFDRAGEIEYVDCIAVDLFDPEYRFSQTIFRYVRTAESEQVIEILRSHIPRELSNPDTCRIDVISGRVVQRWHPSASRNILTGLEG